MKKHRQQQLIIFVFFLSGLLGFIFSLYMHRGSPQQQKTDIEIIQTFHYPALFVKQLEGDPSAGRKIFKEFCAACHDKQPQIDVRAPRIGDQKAWQARRQWGVSTLLKMTINGVGAMPARGGCFECSDEQLQETIQYMLKQNK